MTDPNETGEWLETVAVLAAENDRLKVTNAELLAALEGMLDAVGWWDTSGNIIPEVRQAQETIGEAREQL